ncbi:MAG: protein kinase, partial [bacterium]
MTPERWKEIKLILTKVLEQPLEEHDTFIDKACGDDLDMKKQVNSLLYFHGEIGEFLEKPVIPAGGFTSLTSLVTDKSLLNQGMVLQQRYLILEKIGQGGMGAVYKAQDKRLNNIVALKQIIVSGERLEKAFEQEAQLLAQLRHPALPKVIDYFHEAQSQFLVMEFIYGETLSQLLTTRGKPFEMHQVIAWTEQLLDVLNYLHSHNPAIIHRDIKPNNLKLTKQGQII